MEKIKLFIIFNTRKNINVQLKRKHFCQTECHDKNLHVIKTLFCKLFPIWNVYNFNIYNTNVWTKNCLNIFEV